MGRKKDLETERRKRRALELRLEGVTTAQIAKRLGKSVWVIQKWIRDLGGVPSTRDRVLALWDGVRSSMDIAQEVGVDVRTVNRLVQEEFGPRRKKHTTDENVDRFLSDPVSHMYQRFTRSPVFGKRLVERCLEISDKKPRHGIEVVQPAKELFSFLRARRTSEERPDDTCRFLQVCGLEAHSYMVLKSHRKAVRLLEASQGLAADHCPACIGETHRRLAQVLGQWASVTWSQRKFARAEEHIERAFSQYAIIGSSGHDLLGHGLANCHLVRSHLRGGKGRYDDAADDARKGLHLITPAHKKLHWLLTYSLAVSLFRGGDKEKLAESRTLAAQSVDYFCDNDEATVPQVRALWFAGLLAARCGDQEAAGEYLSQALFQAELLESKADSAALIADLATFDPEKRKVMAQIEGLCHHQHIKPDLYLPSWLGEGLSNLMMDLYNAARRRPDDIADAAKVLRKAAEMCAIADGHRLLPSLTAAGDV